MGRHNKKKKRFGLLSRMITFIILLGILGFGAALGCLCWAEATIPEPGESDAIIVLGCQVKADGSPSVQLEWRMESAFAEYNRQNKPIIVCGAQGKDEPAPEAYVMRDWLVQRGVRAEDILTDPDSYDTRQSIENAAKLLPDGARNVLIVSSDYHLPRCLQIAKDCGLSAFGVGAPCKPEYWVKNHFRETLAWGKYFLTKLTN